MIRHSPSEIFLTEFASMQEHRRLVAAAERRSALDHGVWGADPAPCSPRPGRALAVRLGGLLRGRGGQSRRHTTTPRAADA
jgi:hypothetical protein